MTACEACGSALPDDVGFCPVCAAPVAGRPALPTPTEHSVAVAEPELASPWRRLAAFVIDQAVVTAPAVLLVLVQVARLEPGQGVEALASRYLVNLVPLVGWAALWVIEARTGRTVGNALVGTRTVDEHSLAPAGLRKIFVRHLIQALGGIVCFVGMYVVVVSALWDPGTRRQGWQDRTAGTLVLRTARGRTDVVVPVGSTAPTSTPASPGPPPPPASSHGAPPPTAPLTGAARPPAEPGVPIIAAVPGFSRPAAGPTADSTPVPPAAPSPPGASPADPAVQRLAALAAPSPAPEPAAQDASDVDQTRLAAPAERGDVVLVLPGGERLTVTGDGVLGRNPAAVVGTQVAHLVPVADPTRSVSKTHLAFGLDPVGLWVKDLHSTNGTAVVSPDGTRSLLTAGLAVHVMAGDVVVVGDVEVEVAR